MAATETTWWQYHLFCITNGYPLPEEPGWDSDGDNPVVNVSWHDAVVYCNWRSAREGLGEVYSIDSSGGYENQDNWSLEIKDDKNGYRLPTEAEWQYAATNAGRDAFEYAGSDNPDEVGWYGNNSGSRTRPVMGKKPNALGLYDLSGNVWEWCRDWYGIYPEGEQNNYRGPESGSSRVLRGGSWGNNDYNCSVRRRDYYNPGLRYINYGFRLAQDK